MLTYACLVLALLSPSTTAVHRTVSQSSTQKSEGFPLLDIIHSGAGVVAAAASEQQRKQSNAAPKPALPFESSSSFPPQPRAPLVHLTSLPVPVDTGVHHREEGTLTKSASCEACNRFSTNLFEQTKKADISADQMVRKAQALCQQADVGKALGVKCGVYGDVASFLASGGILRASPTVNGQVDIVQGNKASGFCNHVMACEASASPAQHRRRSDNITSQILQRKTDRVDALVKTHAEAAAEKAKEEVLRVKRSLARHAATRELYLRVKLAKTKGEMGGAEFAIAAMKLIDDLCRSLGLSHSRIDLVNARPATRLVDIVIKPEDVSGMSGAAIVSSIQGSHQSNMTAPVEVARNIFRLLTPPEPLSLLIDSKFGVQLNPTRMPLPPAPAEVPKGERCEMSRASVTSNCGEKTTVGVGKGRALFKCTDTCASSFAGYYALCLNGEEFAKDAYIDSEKTVVDQGERAAELWMQFSDYMLTCKHCPLERRKEVTKACEITTETARFPSECSAKCETKFVPFFTHCLQHEVKYLPSPLQAASYNFYRKCTKCSQKRLEQVMGACEVDGFGQFAQCNAKCADTLLPYVDECHPLLPGLGDFVRKCHEAKATEAKIAANAAENCDDEEIAENGGDANGSSGSGTSGGAGGTSGGSTAGTGGSSGGSTGGIGGSSVAGGKKNTANMNDTDISLAVRLTMDPKLLAPKANRFAMVFHRELSSTLHVRATRISCRGVEIEAANEVEAGKNATNGVMVYFKLKKKPGALKKTPGSAQQLFELLSKQFRNASSPIFTDFAFGFALDKQFGLLRKKSEASPPSPPTPDDDDDDIDTPVNEEDSDDDTKPITTVFHRQAEAPQQTHTLSAGNSEGSDVTADTETKQITSSEANGPKSPSEPNSSKVPESKSGMSKADNTVTTPKVSPTYDGSSPESLNSGTSTTSRTSSNGVDFSGGYEDGNEGHKFAAVHYD